MERIIWAMSLCLLTGCGAANPPAVTDQAVSVVMAPEDQDVDFAVKLNLMKGHLLVARELLDLKEVDQALPHLGHPIEEIYDDLADQLPVRGISDFKPVLLTLQDLVKATPTSPAVATTYQQAMSALTGAEATLPASQRQSPRFVLQVIDGLLAAAGGEYRSALVNGKIAEPIEYQDSRGFVLCAQQLYRSVRTQVVKTNAATDKTIQQDLTRLARAWPAPMPPTAAVLTADEVLTAVAGIKQTARDLR
ncbi:hypothetical protein [Candidatus Cyanaurora vandensis]|uniref:hypothetical protein n=1 Tax=Candidatus Cyanaurora vandensis TaxID=2714958 RepID=UPI00257E70FD|nr:hypothetical protein [Candidatus Cyanaurora vandensis]